MTKSEEILIIDYRNMKVHLKHSNLEKIHDQKWFDLCTRSVCWTMNVEVTTDINKVTCKKCLKMGVK